jgi:hypothetical protein
MVDGSAARVTQSTDANTSASFANLGGIPRLGSDLAAAAQMDYVQLVQERLFRPLGIAESSLPHSLETS